MTIPFQDRPTVEAPGLRERSRQLAAARHQAAMDQVERRRNLAASHAGHRVAMRRLAEETATAARDEARARAHQQHTLDRFLPVLLGLTAGLVAALTLAVLIVVGAV